TPQFIEKLSEDTFYEWAYVAHILYQTEGNAIRSDAFVARGRDMMLLVALALGALLAWWSWRLGGIVCAVAAITLFTFDPNVLGHGALVKNDIALALIFLAVA